MPKLGVNIDHVATLRQQRQAGFPDVLFAANVCEKAGADSIVAHLREDRRHMQDKDIFLLRRGLKKRFNLEMSMARDIVDIACRVLPDQATLVPEKRRELTTEGGLDVVGQPRRVARTAARLKKKGIEVSLFIEPSVKQIEMTSRLGIGIIELHTGRFANCRSPRARGRELRVIRDAAAYAASLGLVVNAGHGLDYSNVCPISSLREIYELNIGYSIICQALLTGLEEAVRQMKALVK
ncbi:MAG: pyridoxine 5'-phosphate synthase [Candidatus Omnitrophota bacterium]